jgi:flagellar protein FlbD
MIRLTRLNHVPLVLNSDLIEHIEVTPDTVITLTSGQIIRVRESAEEVIERVVAFRRAVSGAAWMCPFLRQAEAREAVAGAEP